MQSREKIVWSTASDKIEHQGIAIEPVHKGRNKAILWMHGLYQNAFEALKAEIVKM